MPSQEHTVPAEARGSRLDAFLVSVAPGLSRSRLKSLIESGKVTLDGQRTKPARLLKGGEKVTLVLDPPRPATPQPEQIELRVLFEDSDLIAIDKPAGMVVHPGAGNPRGTLVNALLAHCRDLAGIGGELRPGIVHRLDKDTSGVIVVAKNEPALVALQAQFKRRDVEKTYLAIVHGAPEPRGRFETLHGRHPTDRRRFSSKVKRGRVAVTEWTVERQFDGAALLRVNLFTGRSHQIRVHFAEAGHPILGDALYGGTRREAKLPEGSAVRLAAQAIGRQALHAHLLVLLHPVTSKKLRLESSLPADFQKALEVLGVA